MKMNNNNLLVTGFFAQFLNELFTEVVVTSIGSAFIKSASTVLFSETIRFETKLFIALKTRIF